MIITKLKGLAYAVASFLLWTGAAYGQGTTLNAPEDEVYPQQVLQAVKKANEHLSREQILFAIQERLVDDDRGSFEAAMLQNYILGAGNVVVVRQEQTANRATVEQMGERNVAVLYQIGNRNVTDVLQSGDGNMFGVWLRGEDNALDVQQLGNENTYLLDFTGSGMQFIGDEHRVVQQGNNNQAVQLGVGTAPFNIQQRGDDMELIIEHRRGQ